MKPVWQKTVHFLLAFLLICSNIQPVFARQIPETGTMSTCAMNSAGIRTRPGVTNSESQKARKKDLSCLPLQARSLIILLFSL